MARTILDAVLEVRMDFIEHQLAHVVKDPNGTAYNRTKFFGPSSVFYGRFGRSAGMSEKPSGKIILYPSSNGEPTIEVRLDGDTVWLSQDQMAVLFGKAKSTINEHIKNIFAEGELVAEQVMRKFGISEFSTKPTRRCRKTLHGAAIIQRQSADQGGNGHCEELPERKRIEAA
jgi:hypothetical protein